MNEADVSSKLRVALRAAGAKADKMSDRFHAARPDLYVCNSGATLVIETKIHPSTPTDLQTLELNNFIWHGAVSVVATYNKKTKELHLVNMGLCNDAHFTNYGDAAQWLLLQLPCSSTNKNVLS
jgi:hypothetical protein